MTTKLSDVWTELLRLVGISRKREQRGPAEVWVEPGETWQSGWVEADSLLISAQNVRELIAAKNRRLAEISRERSHLKDKLAKAIAQKKERGSIYNALRALSVEELKLEQGR